MNKEEINRIESNPNLIYEIKLWAYCSNKYRDFSAFDIWLDVKNRMNY